MPTADLEPEKVKSRSSSNGAPDGSYEDFPAPPDRLGRRLAIGLIVSLAINAVLWWQASGFVHRHVIPLPPPMEITRIILPRPPHKIPKPPVKKIVIPQPPKAKAPVKPVVKPRVTPKPAPAAHHHVLTDKSPVVVPGDQTALPGGNENVGKPTDQEANGKGTSAPPSPAPPQPAPAPPPTPEPAPKPQPAPPPQPTAPPQPAPPPRPTGPTQDAQPSNQVTPEIPDDLKEEGNYQSFVRVKVDVAEDGSFTVTLRTSSGNQDVDGRVLDALKKWKWKPALKDGVPLKSSQLFKFEFEVD